MLSLALDIAGGRDEPCEATDTHMARASPSFDTNYASVGAKLGHGVPFSKPVEFALGSVLGMRRNRASGQFSYYT
jgi:hypothetical protein